MIEALFWYCLVGGVIFAFITLLIGDVLGGVVEALFEWGVPFFHPYTLVGTITVFGGSGLVLLRTTDLSSIIVIALSAGVALLSHYFLYAFYVKPIRNSENSTAFRFSDLVGKQGEVTVSIPATGYGEVMIFTTAGHTNQIAASHEKVPIPEGTIVTVLESRDHTLYVVPEI